MHARGEKREARRGGHIPDAAWQYATKAAYTSASAAQSRTAATCTQPWCSETMQSGVDNKMAMLLAARGLGGNEQSTTSLPVERSRRNNKSSPHKHSKSDSDARDATQGEG